MTMALAGPKNSDSAACFNVTKDRSRHRVVLALSDTERNGTVATDPCWRSASCVPGSSEDEHKGSRVAVAIAFFGGALRPSLKDTVQASRHGER